MTAATSLSAQLQAIKSHVQLDESSGTSYARRRPFTRPSILFPPKEAADIDVDTIYDIAMAGFEVLENSDGRFERFRNDLFNHKTKELDRELLTADENKRINASIASYLRLLSGYFRLSSGLKTLEYLIRRNNNTKWRFFLVVKASGAPPTRQVIVQQCIRDLGVLETLCNYASPSNKSQPSNAVVSFFTGVVIENFSICSNH